ncbi:L-histidine N(alpha)-methyltransferase [candidate division GN15 bacterium]|nr:L-histidine N(alpha)-methyltransferase [candidate division GN15 bacterium]
MESTVLSLLSETDSSGPSHREALARDVMTGLSAKQKRIPAKYHYDAEGSRLFNRITGLPEYYLTKAEIDALSRNREAIADCLDDQPVNLIEFGPGDGSKTHSLIGHMLQRGIPVRYVAVDISQSALEQLAQEYNSTLPHLQVECLAADYLAGLRWLNERHHRRNVVLFLGSSIGNFSRKESESFLRCLQGELNAGDLLITGFDLAKDPELIRRAYNDSEDVTAAFNLNVLRHINRKLDGRFDLSQFYYEAHYNQDDQVVKSYLYSRKQQGVHIGGLDRTFRFDRGESIHTEDSRKYRRSDIENLALRTGFAVRDHLFDRKRYFADSIWEVNSD